MSLDRFLLKLEASIVEVLNSHLRKSMKEEGVLFYLGWASEKELA